tara:strand:- start:90 stop:3755 length:3666 start_codon:yes stop_codon:yes gene_type:complete
MEDRCQVPPIEGNQTPVARAGADLRVKKGERVRLDASTSSDVDLDSLTFSWAFVEKPKDSKTALENAKSVQASFIADVPGKYIIRLTVKDGPGAADDDEVTVIVNRPPVANAGGDQLVLPGAVVTLKGSDSQDPDDDPMTFSWSLEKRPVGSVAKLNNAAGEISSFTVDQPGLYIIQLKVSDGFDETTDSLQVQVADPAQLNPQLQALEPFRAPTRSRAVVTLHGRDFLQGAKVYFDEKSLTVDYRSSKRLIVSLDLTSAKVGGHPIKVENPGGKETKALVFQVDDIPVPILTALSPAKGTAGQTADVTLSGTGFVVGAKVYFRDKVIPSTYVNTNKITTKLSLVGLTAGTYEIFVENDPSKRSKAKLFEVQALPPKPRIYKHIFTPGSTIGSIDNVYESLRLTCYGLTKDMQLFIDEKPYKGKIEIQIDNPSNGVGTIILRSFSTKGYTKGHKSFLIKNVGAGQVVESPVYRIRFTNPHEPRMSYLRFDNSSRGATGLDYKVLELRGSNFKAGIEVYFDGKQYTGKIERTGTSSIKIQPYSTKGLKEGAHSVYLLNVIDGKKYKSNIYQYTLQDGRVPLIQSVTTSNGALFTNRTYTYLRIYGLYFQPDATVLFDGVPYKGTVQIDQGRQIFLYQFFTQSFQPGSHTVTVRNVIGGKTYTSKVYTLNMSDGSKPKIKYVRFSPSSQLYEGEVYQATITVDNALTGAKVLVDGVEYPGTVQSAQTVILIPQFSTKGMTVGTHVFQVRNVINGTFFDSNPYQFSIRRRQPPRLYSLTPATISTKQITTVQIRGSFFSATSKVFIGTTALKATFVSSSTLSIQVEPTVIGEGVHRLYVQNVDGQKSNELTLSVLPNLGPLLWGISPASFVVSGNGALGSQQLQLYGYQIQTGAQVYFGTQLIGTVHSPSSQTTPARASISTQFFTKTEVAAISVKNPDGKITNTSELWIQKLTKPEVYSVSPNVISTTATNVQLNLYVRGATTSSKLYVGNTQVQATFTPVTLSVYTGRFRANLNPSTLAVSGDYIPIVIENIDGSKSQPFVIATTASAFRVSYVSPSQMNIGATISQITVRGSGFSSAAVVYLDGQAVPTLYSSSSYLRVTPDLGKLNPDVYHYVEVRDGQKRSNTGIFRINRGPLVRNITPPVLYVGGNGLLKMQLLYSVTGGTLEIFGKSFPLFGSSVVNVSLASELLTAKPGLQTFQFTFPNGQKSSTGAIHIAPAKTP